jgi:CelD/BcsL family acetyltransferase involved in cellulose biosynthesis
VLNNSTEVSSVQDFDGIAGLEPGWRQIFDASSALPFLSPEWLINGWRLEQRDIPLQLCVVRQANYLQAIMPFEFVRDVVAGVPVNVLQFANSGWPTSNDIVLAKNPNQAFGKMLEYLVEKQPRWAFGRFTKLRTDSALLRSLAAQNWSDVRLHCPLARRKNAAIIYLPSTWEEYLARHSKRFRKKIRYYTNVLQRQGQPRLERIGPDTKPAEASEKVARLCADALIVHKNSWQAASLSGTSIGQPEVVDFFQVVSSRLAERGWLELSVLYAGDRPVSFSWGVTRGNRISIAKLGFDQQLAHGDPGKVHMALLIEDSIKLGAAEIDLGHEGLDNKLQWSTIETPLYDLMVFPRRPIPSLKIHVNCINVGWII